MRRPPLERQIAYVDRLRGQPRKSWTLWPDLREFPTMVAEPKIDSLLLATSALPFALDASALDVFCGSGIVGLTLAARARSVSFIDSNPSAIELVRREIARHDALAHLSATTADVASVELAPYSLIVANPPYTDNVVSDAADAVCFDPGHQSVLALLSNAGAQLQPGAKLMLSWADFANFEWLEKEIAGFGLSFRIASTLNEPLSQTSAAMIHYRVYALTREAS